MLVNVTIPVNNEEKILRSSIETLHTFLTQHARFEWCIVIADNVSEDHTLEIVHELANKFKGIHVIHLDKKGQGRALEKNMD